MHEAGGEAGLGGRGAGVALDPLGGLERGRLVAQQARQVAAGLALQEDAGHDRVPGGIGGPQAQPLEDVGRRVAEGEAPGGVAQLAPSGPGRALGRRRDRAADGVPGADGIRQRPGDARSAAAQLAAVAAPPRTHHSEHRDRRRRPPRRVLPRSRRQASRPRPAPPRPADPAFAARERSAPALPGRHGPSARPRDRARRPPATARRPPAPPRHRAPRARRRRTRARLRSTRLQPRCADRQAPAAHAASSPTPSRAASDSLNAARQWLRPPRQA